MTDQNTSKWQKIKEDSEAVSEKMLEEQADEEKFDDSFVASSALEHPDYKALEDKLTLAEQKAHENWEKSVRAMAELENVRRRAEREVSNAHRFALEKFITAQLPVLDSLEQALQMVDAATHKAMHEGLVLTLKLFLNTLEKQGVTPLNPVGEVFNPQEHEAMSMQESSDLPPNYVAVVFQKGYRLHDRVIRAARVIVTKAKREEDLDLKKE